MPPIGPVTSSQRAAVGGSSVPRGATGVLRGGVLLASDLHGWVDP